MTYSSTKPLNFVNSDGIFPAKFFPDNLLPKVTVVNKPIASGCENDVKRTRK